MSTFVAPVAIGDLFVDVTYQRPLDGPRALRMGNGWDRRLAGIIEVSDRGEVVTPRYALIDGAHRWAAAQHANVDILVANVHTGLSVADEARLFDRLNRERRRITTWDHWHARKAAGDDGVVAIENAVAELGLVIDSSPTAGHVRCTATLERLQRLGGTDLVSAALNTVVQVWGRDVSGFDAPIVHGLGLVIHYLYDQIDAGRLVETLLHVQPRHLKSRAAALRDVTTGTTPKLVAIAIMTLYNQRPGRKILVSTRTFGGTARNAHSAAAVES